MSVNLVNGDTLNSDFTAICNKIREKTGDANTIAYAPGNPTNIVNAIDSISGGGATGVNLLNGVTYTDGYYINASGNYVADSKYRYSSLIDVTEGHRYYFVFDTINTSLYTSVHFYNSSDVWQSRYFSMGTTTEGTFVRTIDIPSGITKIRLSVGNSTNSTPKLLADDLNLYPPLTPTFTETVICDNSALSTGNLTFTDDFENYDLLDIELYNTSSLVDFHILTIPSVLVAIKTTSSNQVNFNEIGNNQYKCYTLSADNLSWTVRGSRNLIIKSVKGLVCDNMTVTTTEFYKRNSISPVVATIEPVEDIADYDYIFLGIGDGASDQTQPTNIPIRIDKNDFDTSLGVWHRYNNAGLPVFIDHHSILAPVDYYGNNYFILCAYGVKFE